jgi:lipopolysaccharide export system ATP-binding protein
MQSGEVAGLLGPNGAGKTTTFYIIVGFLHPSTGNVLLNEKDITREPMYKRARLGITYLSQDASVFRKLTVEKNIWAILETQNLNKAEREERLERLLGEFGIDKIRGQYGYTLSGG